MDVDLVRLAQGGDDVAFERLAGASIDRLFAVALRITRDPTVAEDAVQQALVAAWRDLPGLREPERFEAWTYRLLVHACGRELRRRQPWQTRIVALTEDLATTSTPEHLVIEREAVERAFARLGDDQRAVLVLHHYAGLSLAEIAGVVGRPASTVRSRLHLGQAALRAVLEADDRAPSPVETTA